ncbi:hypothetical protein COW36_17640 [bacterium (Candidatus Blackallbacteria) CG17_big_fil_post_rev_8_21_14_2_50_48_46]|uniref:Uroporphyrinogen-III synthase n=1 Tax=bacterium (Candidatus Blackallbacteria) CG17_big_fil_post_rev_8_21_14_2_50_48_46 TaxID=2014261 RepID=A0A2M7G0N8_9BACT|nr:MAG: hypothetical protein COW64_01085 [bacterium (Candidatus Blackallbacteria) CG18_big_fil_WC_8_21_14_2_50_49_26]PIW15242.1 MAG: hypothetical protein COW36_17640 [bacterium (Candidatus Blackallbacteria) CG17_big_fil_post_rev_8_21_14_2_50_48_46]PIW45249.1 MAG: hypothetical protein COW20_21375 [bacterium (Candidatus Blackallbacteria) CG13_big_fil_rev_8_21_14_2_50_49_14]
MLSTAQSHLSGQRVLVSRPRSQTQELESLLYLYGAQPLICPLIQTEPLSDTTALDQALLNIQNFDWLVLTSRKSVEILAQRLHALHLNPESTLGQLKLACVGARSAAELQKLSGKNVLYPAHHQAEDLAEMLCQHNLSGQRVLYLHALHARELVAERLSAAGALLSALPIYQTLTPQPEETQALLSWLEKEEVDILTFASPSAVAHFAEIVPAALWLKAAAHCKIAVIGPITAQAAKQALGRVDILAENASAEGLVQALLEAQA